MRASLYYAMLDPIFASELNDAEACDAHLLPQAICTSGRTIRSNRAFDGAFGHQTDHHLVNLVKNHIDDKVDVEILVPDPEDYTKRVTSFHTKSTLKQDPESGARSGNFTIQYPSGTSDEWREAHLHMHRLVAIRVKEPDRSRIVLSMLHSGHLTASYHLGDPYILAPATTFVREALLGAIQDQLHDDVNRVGDLLHYANQGVQGILSGGALASVLKKALELDPNPLILLRYRGNHCMMPVLPYHPTFTAITFLPGFGANGINEWLELIVDLGNKRPGHIAGVFLTPFKRGVDPAARWHELVGFLEHQSDGGRELSDA